MTTLSLKGMPLTELMSASNTRLVHLDSSFNKLKHTPNKTPIETTPDYADSLIQYIKNNLVKLYSGLGRIEDNPKDRLALLAIESLSQQAISTKKYLSNDTPLFNVSLTPNITHSVYINVETTSDFFNTIRESARLSSWTVQPDPYSNLLVAFKSENVSVNNFSVSIVRTVDSAQITTDSSKVNTDYTGIPVNAGFNLFETHVDTDARQLQNTITHRINADSIHSSDNFSNFYKDYYYKSLLIANGSDTYIGSFISEQIKSVSNPATFNFKKKLNDNLDSLKSTLIDAFSSSENLNDMSLKYSPNLDVLMKDAIMFNVSPDITTPNTLNDESVFYSPATIRNIFSDGFNFFERFYIQWKH